MPSLLSEFRLHTGRLRMRLRESGETRTLAILAHAVNAGNCVHYQTIAAEMSFEY
jgi:hypothetical protein